MSDIQLKKVLESLLKACLSTIDATPWIKGPAVFIVELSSRLKGLRDEDRLAITSATERQLEEAIFQMELATRNAACAAAGTTQVIDLLVIIRNAIDINHVALLEAIDRLRSELHTKYERAVMLAGGLHAALDLASSFARHHNDIVHLANLLAGLIARFEEDVPLDALNDPQRLTLRIARATVASAQQDYDRVLDLIPDTLLQQELALADAQRGRVADLCTLRADACFGAGNWPQALALYQQVLTIRPHHWPSHTSAAYCLVYLGRASEAIEHAQSLVEYYSQIRDGDDVDDHNYCLSVSYACRGVVNAHMGELNAALSDLNHCISLLEQCTKERSDSGCATELAGCLSNRAIILNDLQRRPEALCDANRSISLLEELIEREEHVDLDLELARSYVNRANIQIDMNEIAASLADQAKAVRLYAHAIDAHGHRGCRYDYARVLYDYGSTLSGEARDEEALASFARSCVVLEELADEGRLDCRDVLALSLYRKADAHRQLGNDEAALGAYEQSIAVFNKSQQTVEKHAQERGWACYHAGLIRWKQQAPDAALCRIGSAVELGRRHGDGSISFRKALGSWLHTRAVILTGLGRTTESIDDLKAAVDIFSELLQSTESDDVVAHLARAQHGLAVQLAGDGQLIAGTHYALESATLYRRLVVERGKEAWKPQLEEVQRAFAVMLQDVKRAMKWDRNDSS